MTACLSRIDFIFVKFMLHKRQFSTQSHHKLRETRGDLAYTKPAHQTEQLRKHMYLQGKANASTDEQLDNLTGPHFQLNADLQDLQASESEIEAVLTHIREVKALENVRALLKNLPDASTEMLDQLEIAGHRPRSGIKIG